VFKKVCIKKIERKIEQIIYPRLSLAVLTCNLLLPSVASRALCGHIYASRGVKRTQLIAIARYFQLAIYPQVGEALARNTELLTDVRN
jgi:hypothetical protein